MKVHEVKEVWATHNLKGFKEINKNFLKKDVKTGIPDLDELIKEQMEKQAKIGFPLKIYTHTLQSSKKGKLISEVSSTMEVTSIKFKSFPKSFFEVPKDYTRMEGPRKKKLGII